MPVTSLRRFKYSNSGGFTNDQPATAHWLDVRDAPTCQGIAGWQEMIAAEQRCPQLRERKRAIMLEKWLLSVSATEEPLPQQVGGIKEATVRDVSHGDGIT